MSIRIHSVYVIYLTGIPIYDGDSGTTRDCTTSNKPDHGSFVTTTGVSTPNRVDQGSLRYNRRDDFSLDVSTGEGRLESGEDQMTKKVKGKYSSYVL